MNKIEGFKNAPVGATATNALGNRAMRTRNVKQSWVTSNGIYLTDDSMELRGYTLDPLPEPLYPKETK